MSFSENTQKKLLQVLVCLIGFFFLLSGFLEITRNPVTYTKTLQMGYPPYFILLLGIIKIAGVAALWQKKIKWLREWAFAGFTFDAIFAFVSGCAISSIADCIKSAFAFLVIVYTGFALRKITQNKTSN